MSDSFHHIYISGCASVANNTTHGAFSRVTMVATTVLSTHLRSCTVRPIRDLGSKIGICEIHPFHREHSVIPPTPQAVRELVEEPTNYHENSRWEVMFGRRAVASTEA